MSSKSDPGAGLDGRARGRIRLAGLTAGLLACALVLLLGERLSRPLFDLFQNVSPEPPASTRVHVVVIDADSLQAVGGWPWSRYYLARLVEEIAARQPAAIGLDLLMPEPDRVDPAHFADLYAELSPSASAEVRALPPMDQVFSRVIGRSPVVLARAGLTARSFDALDKPADPGPPAAAIVGALPAQVARYPHAVASLPLLDGAALGHGLVNGEPDSDGVVRRVPLVAGAAGHATPGFALELARVAENIERVALETAGGKLNAVRLGDRHLPANADGRLALRFGDWRKVKTTSAANLLRKGLPADLFKGEIVLVGLTSAGASDVVATPRASQTYGVFVQAQAVEAILRGEGLREPGWARPAAWVLGVLLALAGWAAVSRLPIRGALAAAVAATAAALGGSWLAFQSGQLIDPFPMLLPAAATSAATLTSLFVEGRRLQARLRASLQEERVKAARVAGELAAAADIQAGMLLPRADLAKLGGGEVQLDAVLQPARNVGGDLYDAFRLADGRLCFLVGDVTGKGVAAALFMALSKSLARNLLMRPKLDLTAAVAELNAELFLDNREAMALSLLVGVLEPEGRLRLCCAGHENPLIASPDGAVRDVPLIGGPPLCVDPSFPYATEDVRLEPGETLLAFSDGLTEAQAPDGALLTRQALFDLVGQAVRAPTAAAMVDAVVAGVRAFEAGSEPSDDLTILALRRG